MALFTNLNTSPYYDDYSHDKKYLKLLFKPGYAVQARELTQIQSSLQNQIQKFGDHVFKNGSVVTGGQFFLQSATYLKVDPSYGGTDIDYADFVGKTIASTDLTKRGEVIVGFPATDSDPITLMVKQLYGTSFVSGETIITREDSAYSANIATSGVGTGQIFSVNDGVFYYDGYFVSVDAQTVATSKYSANTASARIGFEITESIINNNSDSSLLDPAQDASNYQAPGADRYKIELVLSTRDLDSEDDDRFIELMQVQNGVSIKENRYPIYSVLEDTFARRTYDESGNYTVRPFNISLETNSANSAQTNIILSPGKAYVYGYEFETNSPTVLTVDKPRTTSNVNNKAISSDYGNYIYTTNHYGAFPLKTLGTLDVHCVNTASINTTSTGTIANTKIGTVRVKTIAFDSSANTSNSATYNYKTFLFDTNIGSITGNVVSANSTNITLGSNFSSVDNAYTGAKLRITSGPGSTEPSKVISAYVGTTKNVVVTTAFTTVPTTASSFSLDFEFNDAESLANFSSNTRTVSADIESRSKDMATAYQDVIISDASYEPLIFNLGELYVANNTISDISYYFKQVYVNQAFTSSETTLSLSGDEQIPSASTIAQKQDNLYIAVTTQGTSPYTVGTVIPANLIEITDNVIAIPNANNMVATVIASVYDPNPTVKTKTYITANSTIQTSGGTDVFSNTAFISYTTEGQAHIKSTFVNKIPGNLQSLYVADVTEIVEVKDFNGYGISEANTEYSTDITSYYTLDTGQKDSYYDHSAIILKSGVGTPVGPLLVRYNRFSTTSTYGFFTVDSYSGISYENIPSYTSPVNNSIFNLRDCIDFRPVKVDHGTFDTNGTKIPVNGSSIILDYEYYLPRIDKVILDKTRVFEIVKGTPRLNPLTPKDTTTGMTLFVLNNPPYVLNTKDIYVKQIDHRRYTMRDIGAIDKRVQNLEYYTALTLLEQETMTKQDLTILDSQNLARFKNGIVVDSFTGHSIADVTNSDYKASIDRIRKELRPSFSISAHKLNFDSANSVNYTLSDNGYLVSLTANTVSLIQQPKASKSVNINPFNVINYLGKINLYPPTDIWVDDSIRPDVLVNLGGNNDAWELIAETPISYEWGAWNTTWTGVEVTDIDSNTVREGTASLYRDVTTTTTTKTTTSQQTRSGVATYIVPETITQSIGTSVVDVSIIPYMREANILFVGKSFKPSTIVYPFFDNKSVVSNVGNRVNKFHLANNNIGFDINYSNPEVITIKNAANNAVLGTGLVVAVSNNIVYVTNITATSGFANCKIVGSKTSLSYNASGYYHNGGTVLGSDSNSITLDIHASGANNVSNFVGSYIHINQGLGVGQSREITAYNPSTRVATISPNWNIRPYSASIPSYYGIGNLETDESGAIVGVFTIPTNTFRVGEKLFRLMDSEVGDLSSSSTSGDAAFYAQGLLQTLQETIVSTIQPSIERASVQDARVVTSTSTTSETVAGPWIDPVAQSFLVDPRQFPEGIFLRKIRCCFKTKDPVIPVTLQVRPTVNGYPSSSTIYPYSTVTLTPDKINITTAPDITNSSKYTDFIFEAPVYLLPGEHSFVLIANTNKYETYLAEIGKTDLVTNKLISEQPYGGSYFASQNSSTWTADQTSDLMFEIFRAEFDDLSGLAQFNITSPNNAVPYSALQLITSDIVIAKTSLNYLFKAEKLSGGYSDYTSIIPGKDYELIDSSGLKVLSNTSGNNTFTLSGYMSSSSSVISPIIDISRPGILVIENKINNLELSNNDFVIVNGGDGYTDSANVVITISGGGGSSATATANVSGGIIDNITLTNAGSGYYSTPTIEVSTLNATGANASIEYIGETNPIGGNAIAKYMCRKVTLTEGFNSGDLRVYITTYKPTGTNVYVYYKMLSESDPDKFENKSWQLMTQLGNNNFVSSNELDYRELTFAPGSNGVANNSVSYTSEDTAYSTFRTFAIKIVLSSANPTIVPKVRDFRAIAFPSG